MSLKEITGVSKSNNTQGVSEIADIDGEEQQHYENILRSGYSVIKNVFVFAVPSKILIILDAFAV